MQYGMFLIKWNVSRIDTMEEILSTLQKKLCTQLLLKILPKLPCWTFSLMVYCICKIKGLMNKAMKHTSIFWDDSAHNYLFIFPYDWALCISNKWTASTQLIHEPTVLSYQCYQTRVLLSIPFKPPSLSVVVYQRCPTLMTSGRVNWYLY